MSTILVGTLAPALPVLVIIDHQVLARTCILSILKRELSGFDIVEMAKASGLNWLSERDVRLIALHTGDKQITDPLIEHDLALVKKFCPNAAVALLSNRDDDASATAAMQQGVRGFFPTSIPVEVAVAGLRLVLAGGVYRPPPSIKQNEAANPRPEINGSTARPVIHVANDATEIIPEKTMAELTPRQQQVLSALKLGLPNKLIAVKLNLSENTVKMHIQHIMRKCSAHNRTEAVLRWSERLSGYNGRARSRVPLSY